MGGYGKGNVPVKGSAVGVVLRDSTLRAGLDVPGVSFSEEQKVAIAEGLALAGVPEVEVVSADRVLDDLRFAANLIRRGVGIKTSGLIHAASPAAIDEMGVAAELLDRFDLLMSLSEQQPPLGGSQKVTTLLRILEMGRSLSAEVGVGFPYAMQTSPLFLLEISRLAVKAGATRVTFYDTSGNTEPFALRTLLQELVTEIKVPIFFHGSDGLGLALANAWAAVQAGARGLGVSSTGLGYPVRNACLEQVALLLARKNVPTGVHWAKLGNLARLVAGASGVPLSRLAPIVDDLVRDPDPLASMIESD